MKGRLSSWTMYIPGVSNSPEVAELKKFQEIIKCMTDAELDSTEANLSGQFIPPYDQTTFPPLAVLFCWLYYSSYVLDLL